MKPQISSDTQLSSNTEVQPNIRAIEHNIVRCHCCGVLHYFGSQPNVSELLASQTTQDNYEIIENIELGQAKCVRCHSHLHLRKPNSLQRTFALIVAASILYIPANVLPMTITESILDIQKDTIMSGVIYFWQNQDYLVATVIFIASIFIPILKLFILCFLLLAVSMQSSGRWRFSPKHCSLLYRVVEFIGRWSMIDVFVVSLLTALIQIQSLATILAGPGSVAFAAVVILTMLASLSFDPRLIWDNYYAYQTKPLSQHEHATTKTHLT